MQIGKKLDIMAKKKTPTLPLCVSVFERMSVCFLAMLKYIQRDTRFIVLTLKLIC